MMRIPEDPQDTSTGFLLEIQGHCVGVAGAGTWADSHTPQGLFFSERF